MDTLKEQLDSKKFRAFVAALIVWAVGLFGLDINTMDVLPVLGLAASYIIGQGQADKGKSAAKELAAVEREKLAAGEKANKKKASAKKR